MEENFDSNLVPSLTVVVDNIYSSCDLENKNQVSVSNLLDYIRPLMAANFIEKFKEILDPNDENPLVSKNSFEEAMGKWATEVKATDSDLTEISFKEESSNEKFQYSSNRPSLGLEEMSNFLNFSSFSPKSCSSASRISQDNKIKYLEEKNKEFELKYQSAVREISLIKSQLTAAEEQNIELKMDLERNIRRLVREQQVNKDLQKSMEYRDNINNDLELIKEENENFQKMLNSSKKEIMELRDYVDLLETEKEEYQKQISGYEKKDQQAREEHAKLNKMQTALLMKNDEIESFQKLIKELYDELKDKNNAIEQLAQFSDMLKEDNDTLKTVIKEKSLTDLNNLSLKSPDVSFPGTPKFKTPPSTFISKSLLNSSPPFRNMYRPSFFDREIFNNFGFLQKISKSLSPNTLETPQNIKSTKLLPHRIPIITFENCGKIQSSRKVKEVDVADCSEKTTPNRQNLQKKFSETPDSSPNQVCEIIDNMDLSLVNEKPTFEGENLLSELQASNYFEYREKCSVEDHADWLKIVKEHENCSKIIAEYQNQIADFTENLKKIDNEHNNLLEKYKNMEEDAKSLEESLDINRTENLRLKEENADLNKTNKEFLNRVKVLEDQLLKYSQLVKNVENEKDALNELVKVLENEKDELMTKMKIIVRQNEDLAHTITTKDVELGELHELNTKLENDHKRNCQDIEKLSLELEQCNLNGKKFTEAMKKKFIKQNTKIRILNDFNGKLEQLMLELRSETEMNQTKLNKLESMINETREKREKIDDSTSTESSEINLCAEPLKYKKKSLSYEKQQLKLSKLEEKIDTLENDLRNENQKISNLEFQITNLNMEKVSLEEEKNSISRELEATKYELSLKEEIMNNLRENHNFEMEKFKESFEIEKERNVLASLETEKKASIREQTLIKQIETLEQKLGSIENDKKNLEILLGKKENNVIALSKALSELSTTAEEVNNFEKLIVEKESMLNFSRKLLAESNNSLEETEKKLSSLEIQIEKYEDILLDTAKEIFSSTKIVFQTCKESLELDNKELIEEMNSCMENGCISEITEENLQIINRRLILSSNLLKALAKKFDSYKKEAPSKKSKFTLKPSKLGVVRFSSSPEISHKYEGDVADNEDTSVEQNVFKSNYEEEPLKENESIIDCLEHGSQNLRKALGDREMIEKKFNVLALTWKSNYENSKKRYTNSRQQCSKLRNSYLHVLLQVVTHIRNHKCQQEQKSLIKALTLIEKLKDLIFDVFKLAGQYGASKQDLHSMKCWNLIVDHVNAVHLENKKLRSLSSTRARMVTDSSNSNLLRLRNIPCGILERTGSYPAITEDSSSSNEDMRTSRSTSKCSMFMMVFVFVCLILMFLMVLQMECKRNIGGFVMCPLDSIFSTHKESPPLL